MHVDSLEEDEKRTREFQVYFSRIIKQVNNSENPIFVSPGGIRREFPSVPEIETIPYQLATTGKILKSEAYKLCDILGGFNTEDQFRIHGAYLGQCTSEFASQLYGLIYAGIYWPDYCDKWENPIEEERTKSHRRLEYLLDSGQIQKSNIRLGIVFSKRNRRINEMVKQLCDKETEIYLRKRFLNHKNYGPISI